MQCQMLGSVLSWRRKCYKEYRGPVGRTGISMVPLLGMVMERDWSGAPVAAVCPVSPGQCGVGWTVFTVAAACF